MNTRRLFPILRAATLLRATLFPPVAVVVTNALSSVTSAKATLTVTAGTTKESPAAIVATRPPPRCMNWMHSFAKRLCRPRARGRARRTGQ